MKSLHQSPSNPKIRLKWDRFPCIKSKTSEELIPDDEVKPFTLRKSSNVFRTSKKQDQYMRYLQY